MRFILYDRLMKLKRPESSRTPAAPPARPAAASKQASPPGDVPSMMRDDEFLHAALMIRNANRRAEAVSRRRNDLLKTGAIVFLALIAGLLAIRPPQHTYFAVDEENRITPIIGLSHPMLSQAALSAWVAQAMIAVNTYDSANYKQQLSAVARKDFTLPGWDSYNNAMIKSGTWDYIKSQHVIVSATMTGAPVIIQAGVAHGHYEWIFQVPMVVTYQGLTGETPQNITYQVTVVRTEVYKHPSGVAIQSINFKGQGA
ncbi:hypothetical protein FE249_18160 (plasmid) [Acidiphilium multivorum]|nr:hypothetical protein FE249_18160 [Acidiphilium multivorum]